MYNTSEYCSSPTMDNLETASNISDGVSSNLSSLSGLTGYEEELCDLKHFIKLPSSSPRSIKPSDNNHGQFEVFEERIKTLNIQLQNTLKINEKYKNDMCNLERKTELAFHEKFEKLMRHNTQLEAQLSVANDRIHNFLVKSISDCSKHNENGRTSELERNQTKLEKQNFELHSKIDLLQSEVTHWKKEAETNEVLNSRLKLEIEEMRIEVSTKSNSIDALKSKIVDLHLEMQNLNQDNVKVHNLLAITSNELDSFKKSEKWYKEQLHQCRAQKSEALEEISKLQLLLIGKDRDFDVQKSDFLRLKNNFDELQLGMFQEKQNLLKTIDQLQFQTSTTKEAPKSNVEDQNISENYESTIESLTRELISIKEAINEQQSSFEGINKQNSDLITRNTTLLKNLNEKEIFVSNLESDKKDLKVKLEILSHRLRQNENLLMKTVNEKAEIEVGLSGANREKREIEDAIKTIRENFSKFAANYNKIKEELNEKNKQIFQLQNESFKYNSGLEQLQETKRKVAELEEINRKLNQHILELQHEQANFNSCLTQLTQTKRKLEELQELNFKLQTHMENLEKTKSDWKATNETKERLEGQVVSYQKVINNLKEELQVLRENMAMVTNDLQLKDKLVGDLRQELNNLTGNIELHQKINQGLMEKLNIAEKSLRNSQNKFEETHNLNTLLKEENLELKDKVAKFVTNNFNGFSNRMNKTNDLGTNKKEDVCMTVEHQNQLEVWVLSILDWIFSNLREIQACNNLNQTKFVSNFSQQWTNIKIEPVIDNISKVLVSISSTRCIEFEELHRMSLTNKQLKQHLSEVKSTILERLTCIEDKCHLLDKRQEEDLEILHNIKTIDKKCDCTQMLNTGLKKKILLVSHEKLQEDLKQLKILCKAKELENNEKRKRFEVNNRTLLKKVKEHMRGRNSAEKRCSYLQELYNNVFDELNSYKLQENSKDGEIQNLQNICENYKNINTKMKNELLRIEKELRLAEATKALVCVKCVEYESLKNNLTELEAKLKIYEDQLKEKETLMNNIQVKMQQTVLNNTTLQKENRNLLENVKKLNSELDGRKEDTVKLEVTLEKERRTMEEVQIWLLDEQKQHSACIMQVENAQQLSQHTHEKNKLLSEEIELLNSKLNHSKNKFNNLKAQNNLLEDDCFRKEAHMQTFVMNLQAEIQILQDELISVRSDKQFLQRLCGDLKLSLQTSMNQSKVLKQHVQTLSSESKECNSLSDPMANLPSPSKYDDAYINQLLKESSAPSTEKPLGDLQNCLNSLKKEMSCLRKQVTDRAGYRV